MAKRGKVKSGKTLRGEVKRPIRLRRYEQLFLIVCEDEKTEPAYFEQFKLLLPKKTLYLDCIGTGRDSLGVVQQAIKSRDDLAERGEREVDFVWVVFDKDDADIDEAKLMRFEEAMNICVKEKIEIALSNEVFELWLLLHLESVVSAKPVPRASIYKRLEAAVKKHPGEEDFVYEHGKLLIIEKINKCGNEATAIRRAERLSEFFAEIPPILSNPSTQVHLLVKELRSLIRFYGGDDT